MVLAGMSAYSRPRMSRCRFGLFEFDLLTGELRREGEIVKLPPQPTRVLTLLLERPGDLVLREQLRDRIWGHDTFVDFERGLNFCILQVRAALGDVPENPRFVQTVPRRATGSLRLSRPAPAPCRPAHRKQRHLPSKRRPRPKRQLWHADTCPRG
jgi:hypothetical protein